MKTRITTLAAITALAMGWGAPSFAAKLSCDALKSQVASKLDGKGIKNYHFELVPSSSSGKAGAGKVVGTCEGGAQQLVYSKK